jgi:hypothetical protein
MALASDVAERENKKYRKQCSHKSADVHEKFLSAFL